MGIDFKISSLYVCVNDMNRAINFYEELFGQKVTVRDEIYSVFDINGFRYGLFNYKEMNEKHVFGNNCLPSVEVNNISEFKRKLEKLQCSIVFPLTKIGENIVLEFIDSEGNHIEGTYPIDENTKIKKLHIDKI